MNNPTTFILLLLLAFSSGGLVFSIIEAKQNEMNRGFSVFITVILFAMMSTIVLTRFLVLS